MGVAGCLGRSPDGDDESTDPDETDRTAGNRTDPTEYDHVDPAQISQGTFVLDAKFVAHDDVEAGFDIVSSDDERIGGIALYEDLFETVETLSADERIEGHYVASTTARVGTGQGGAVLRAVDEIRDDVNATEHETDRWGNRHGSHYVEQDGALLLVCINDGGVEE